MASKSLSSICETTINNLRGLLGNRFYELLSTYSNDCRKREKNVCEMMRVLLSEEDIDMEQTLSYLASQIHAIKGSSRNIGANSLAEICEQMEADARAKNVTGLQQNISGFEKNIAAVLSEINQLRSLESV